MLRLRRFPRRTFLVLVVLVVSLSLPLSARAAASRAAQGTSAPLQQAPVQLAPVQPAPGQPVAARTMAATSPATASGGLCSVPGIGDIGGLLGFCSLGQAGLTGDLNNICQPSVPDPEPADSGIDALVKPPAAAGLALATPYNQYGVAGTNWAATNMQCSDMTSLIGNSVAGMLLDVAKAIDRVTITVYQAAAGEGILAWLRDAADRLITSLGNAIYFPYLAIVVIIGAIWLAWQGLIRKRATRTIEGTVWMVVACTAAIWLIGRPADFTGAGKGVSDGIAATLNAAFAKLPSPGQGACLPVRKGDPQIAPSSFSYTSGGTVVDQNASELWTVLVCKPWLAGEFGTTVYAPPGTRPTPVNTYARQLLWAQAIAVNERPTSSLIQAKQATYRGIAQSIQRSDPGIYPLFQGKEWTTRLQIAFAALLAAVLAGVLVLLISVTLIVLKLGFLLLLIVGPFFLLIGTHPGFGRVVALRWFEMLVGVLLKQAAVALVLSVLLYCYALIMGTSDSVLPWALKILMIALVTAAAFIYRRPFQHLFSAAGYGMIGATERAEVDLRRAGSTLRGSTIGAAAAAVPAFAAYRAARLARRNPAQAAGLALGTAPAGDGNAAAAGGDGAASAADLEGYPAADGAVRADGNAAADGTRGSGRAGLSARVRARTVSAGNGAGRDAPPLNLPPRDNSAPAPPGSTRSGDTASPGRVPAARSSAHGAGASGPAGAAAGPARAPAGPAPARAAAPGARPAVGSGGIRVPSPSGPWSGAPRPPAPQAARGSAPSSARPGTPSGSSARPGAPPSAPSPGRPPPAGAAEPGVAHPFAPRRADPPPRRLAPTSARQQNRAAAASSQRPMAPPPRSAGYPGAGTGDAAWPGRQGEQPAAPLAGGQQRTDQPEPPVPFWLRPVRRRK